MVGVVDYVHVRRLIGRERTEHAVGGRNRCGKEVSKCAGKFGGEGGGYKVVRCFSRRLEARWP